MTAAVAEPVQAEADRLVMRAELAEKLGNVSGETMRRWMRDGKLPKPDVALSLRTKGWMLSTLRAHGIKLA